MIRLIILVLALACFIASAFGLSTGKVNLMALGLALFTLSLLIPPFAFGG
jgi:hypothetical protein